MSNFAEKTNVPVEKSRMEIERILQRYGASEFMSGWDTSKAMIAFQMSGRRVKFLLPLPDKDDKKFTRTPAGRAHRSADGRLKAWEQACRQRWRALALVIKAKLEAVESGITCFEDEFMAHIVLPDGGTVGDHVRPSIAQAYESGTMVALLPDLREE